MDNITYGEAIDELIRLSDVIYDQAGGLRDHATSAEKEYWNRARGQASALRDTFQKLDTSLSCDSRSGLVSFSLDQWKAWVKKRMRW